MCFFSVETKCNCADYQEGDHPLASMSEDGRSPSKSNFGKRYRRTTRFRSLVESSALSTHFLKIPEAPESNCDTCWRDGTRSKVQGNSSSCPQIKSSENAAVNGNGTPKWMTDVLSETRKVSVTRLERPPLENLKLKGDATVAKSNWMRVVEKATPTKPKPNSLCKAIMLLC